MYATIGIWIGAFFTLAIYSFLYKENPIYRLAEHLVVGISLGYGMAITYEITLKPRLIEPLLSGDHWILLIPGILGIDLCSWAIKPYGWNRAGTCSLPETLRRSRRTRFQWAKVV